MIIRSGFAILALGLIGTVSGFCQRYAPEPKRIQIRTARTTIPLRSQGELTLLFLDRNYRPTTLDAKRAIELQVEPAGAVDLRRFNDAQPGQHELAVPFTGAKPGRVWIRALSKGLEPAAVLITIIPSK